ncbi:uncharacterized protein LY89DRAFT_747203 [Mollisia scopiformis]|uniref:Uncharacterized protein n=1 Tax=Mollisia scopiformis TaxID=149040 RepID=A0A194XCQ4_MOLSC|nr:uncharacterized protein LY89DRAFT_747203 [Mollisia scopiformis]KUJ17537.1 hypothetical protein LY89DRAFT_747203 [Mollisia scopiformis]
MERPDFQPPRHETRNTNRDSADTEKEVFSSPESRDRYSRGVNPLQQPRDGGLARNQSSNYPRVGQNPSSARQHRQYHPRDQQQHIQHQQPAPSVISSFHSQPPTPSANLWETTHVLLPFLFFTLFSIFLTVVVIYSLSLHESLPTRFLEGIGICFAVIIFLWVAVILWVKVKRVERERRVLRDLRGRVGGRAMEEGRLGVRSGERVEGRGMREKDGKRVSMVESLSSVGAGRHFQRGGLAPIFEKMGFSWKKRRDEEMGRVLSAETQYERWLEDMKEGKRVGVGEDVVGKPSIPRIPQPAATHQPRQRSKDEEGVNVQQAPARRLSRKEKRQKTQPLVESRPITHPAPSQHPNSSIQHSPKPSSFSARNPTLRRTETLRHHQQPANTTPPPFQTPHPIIKPPPQQPQPPPITRPPTLKRTRRIPRGHPTNTSSLATTSDLRPPLHVQNANSLATPSKDLKTTRLSTIPSVSRFSISSDEDSYTFPHTQISFPDQNHPSRQAHIREHAIPDLGNQTGIETQVLQRRKRGGTIVGDGVESGDARGRARGRADSNTLPSSTPPPSYKSKEGSIGVGVVQVGTKRGRADSGYGTGGGTTPVLGIGVGKGGKEVAGVEFGDLRGREERMEGGGEGEGEFWIKGTSG